MSTKKINAGDTLTVGDLTDDHLGAVIEVEQANGLTTRLELNLIERSPYSGRRALRAREGGVIHVLNEETVKVITPPPVVQPDEPTELGQCIRIEGDDWRAMVVEPNHKYPIRTMCGKWINWEEVLSRAGDRQIIVSDPPRWPDETPEVPERIEVGEWPADDTHLRAWEWIERDGYPWWWNAQLALWESEYLTLDTRHPLFGPWTRGNRVEETDARVAQDNS